MISPERALALRPELEALRAWAIAERRIADDPVEIVHRYDSPRDREVAGLFCASLAYGRVDLFKPLLGSLLGAMGRSPAAFCEDLPQSGDLRPFAGKVYRFNVGSDLACLAWACGVALRSHGSLEALFRAGLSSSGAKVEGTSDPDAQWRLALSAFTSRLREQDFSFIRANLGPPRALDHLLPRPEKNGACKRLHLYLRWMVRRPDGVDLGVWSLPPSRLSVPLDTHLGRMAKNLGLTGRRDLGYRTALEITRSLRRIDPLDPVKYDFALCHFGMSGLCPARRAAPRCRECVLLRDCLAGQKIVRLNPVGTSGIRSGQQGAEAPSSKIRLRFAPARLS
jgi:uncharacterized protein (TIGR02757 family)